MNTAPSLQLQFDGLQQRAVRIGIGGLLLGLIGGFFNPAQFFHSYLLAYLFWLGISLGCLATLMLHHLVGGAWGFVIRRVLEAGTRTLPFMVALFIPLLVGLQNLYSWAQPEAVAGDALLQHKSPYLNVPFFVIRGALYFAVWIGIAHFLNKWSLAQDKTGDPSLASRLELLSGPGLVLYGATVTFAAIDWAMSLDAHWFSTIYGITFMVGQVLTTLAFVIMVVMLLAKHPPLSEVLTPNHFHDLGNLLLAFVMLWAYVAFSQYLIIWSGNIPEEIPWYLHRMRGGWQGVSVFLIVFHFIVPFLILLSRRTKRSLQVLSTIAGTMIFMRLVDLFWLIVPAAHHTGLHLHWLDGVILIGVGGIWIAAFIRQLKDRPLLPLQDPYHSEAFGHAEPASGS